jgi:DNA polymerase I-like protein with 3'-5' exonuclease and polymerase domains
MHKIQDDYQVLKGLVKGEVEVVNPVRVKGDYRVVRTAEEVRDELSGCKVVAVDTEWARGGPWCLSYSVNPGTATVVMAEDVEAVKAVGEVTSRESVVTVIHNVLYDLNVLDIMGVQVANPEDTMVIAYLLQSEPQGLKDLAYRHLKVLMRDYSDVVGGASHTLAMSYLASVVEREWKDPEPVVGPSGKVSQPQNIKKKVARLLSNQWQKWVDEGEEVDVRGKWRAMTGVEVVEEVLGEMAEGELCDVDRGEAVHYAAQDADMTIRLYPILRGKVDDVGMVGTFKRDMGIMGMVAQMMRDGVRVSRTRMEESSRELVKEIESVKKDIDKVTEGLGMGVVNPQSTQQVGELLYKRLRLPVYKKTKGGESSTSSKVLSRLEGSNPVVGMITKWRHLNKLNSDFCLKLADKADSDGRVRSTWRVTKVDTGRLSCSSPNLMAIPTRTSHSKLIRKGFVATDGWVMVSADYSQVEMRVAAHCSQDEVMLKVFLDNLDIHKETAARMFEIPLDQVDDKEHRYPAKRVGFGILYGISGVGLRDTMVEGGASEKDWPVDRCQDLIDRWFKVYYGVARYMKEGVRQARRYGYVKDMFGRCRFLPGVRSCIDNVREAAERQAGNAQIQMGAAGIIKEAMGQLWGLRDVWGEWARPLIQIHDDLVFEVREEMLDDWVLLQTSVMESAVRLSVPLLVDAKVGPSWGELVDYQ